MNTVKPRTSGLTQKSKLERYYTFQIVAMDSDEWTNGRLRHEEAESLQGGWGSHKPHAHVGPESQKSEKAEVKGK